MLSGIVGNCWVVRPRGRTGSSDSASSGYGAWRSSGAWTGSWWSAERAVATAWVKLAVSSLCVCEASAGSGVGRRDTRTNWLSGRRNDIELRKMATGRRPRSADCRHVPEASELNGEDGCCLEVVSRRASADRLAWEHQSPAGRRAIGCSVARGAALVRVGACVVLGPGDWAQAETQVYRRWIVAETPRDTRSGCGTAGNGGGGAGEGGGPTQ